MNIQDFLTYLLDAITCGFIALALLDLGDRVTYEILDIFCTIASTPGAQKELVYASAFETEASLKSLQPQTFEMPVVEDPWLTVIAPCNTACCYLSTTPPTQKPLLLLPPVLEIPNQPDLAAMPSTELRRLCSERGIKWRNAHQSKHLTKPEMLTALTT